MNSWILRMGNVTSHNLSVRVPGFGVQNFCFSTNKKNIEKDNKKLNHFI
jgi:hypothetical protein